MAYRRARGRRIVGRNQNRGPGAGVGRRKLTSEQQERVLDICHGEIRGSLDMKELFPHLVEQGLLTRREKELLRSENKPDEDKADLLLSWLPRKGDGVLKKFVTCLKKSSDGTAHGELAKKIKVTASNVLTGKEHTRNGSFSPKKRSVLTALVVVGVLAVGVVAVLMVMWENGRGQTGQAPYHSKSLPNGILSELFVGRDEDVAILTSLLDFERTSSRIVSIVGSPGFGKSMLAIHVGDQMAKAGITVHYVNTFDASNAIALTEVVFSIGIVGHGNSLSRLQNWASSVRNRTLIIFDNCDDSLHQNQDEFQQLVGSILDASPLVRVLTTSRKRVLYLKNFQLYPITELSAQHGDELLNVTTPGLSMSQRKTILDVTGNVPLALSVIGSLLKHNTMDSSAIIKELQTHPIPTLSTDELPGNKQVFRVMDFSYKRLTLGHQTCARYLANFPGVFSKEAANEVVYDMDVPACLKVIVQASLLEKGDRHGHYRFHKLIKEFLLYTQNLSSPEEPADFMWRFRKYYTLLLSNLTVKFSIDPSQSLSRLDSDKPNFRYLFEVMRSSPDIISSVFAMETIVHSFDLKILHSRFSVDEMVMLFEGLLKHMDSNFNTSSREIGFVKYFELYVDLMLILRQFPDSEEGRCKILDLRWPNVEWLASNATGRNASEAYLKYYYTLKACFGTLGLHDEVKKCRAKISKKVEDMEQSQEDYGSAMIGRAHFYAGHYHRALHFFEMAKEQEVNILLKLDKLIWLYDLYTIVDKNGKAQAVVSEAGQLYGQLSTANVTITNYKLFVDVAKLYRKIDMPNQANEILERILTFYMQAYGDKSPYTISFVLSFAEFLKKIGNYSGASKLVEFAVDSSKSLKAVYPLVWVNALQKGIIVEQEIILELKVKDLSAVVEYEEQLLQFLVEYSGVSPGEQMICGRFLTLTERHKCLLSEIDKLLDETTFEDANYGTIGLSQIIW